MTSKRESFSPAIRTNVHTILIVTDNIAEAKSVSQALAAQGYKTIFSIFDGRTLKRTPVKAPDAALFIFTKNGKSLPVVVKALKKHFQATSMPFIGTLEHDDDINHSLFDSVIFRPAHISQIATRINSMMRLGQMEREIKRRIITLREYFNIDYSSEQIIPKSPFRILFVGKASPEFMVIINALQKKNVEIVAAFTSFSAFDYLHESQFDAVVMNALEQSEPALSITQTMQRNAKLYHVPILFLVNTKTFTDHNLAYEKGVKDIISADSNTHEISGRVLELANFHRIHTQFKREFEYLNDANIIDKHSGVFNKDFFRAHMRTVFTELKSREEPVSMVAIKASPNELLDIPDNYIINAMNQIGQMLKNLVRMQDVIARISDDIFVISFIEENNTSAISVCERINSIVNCVSFESGTIDNDSLVFIIDCEIADMSLDISSDVLIDNMLAKLSVRMPVNQSSAEQVMLEHQA